MKSNDKILRLVDRFYRARETSKLSIKLAETSSDLVYELVNLCKKNNIIISKGTIRLVDEVQTLLKRIEQVNTLPFDELMKIPSAWPPTNLEQPDETTDNGAGST